MGGGYKQSNKPIFGTNKRLRALVKDKLGEILAVTKKYLAWYIIGCFSLHYFLPQKALRFVSIKRIHTGKNHNRFKIKNNVTKVKDGIDSRGGGDEGAGVRLGRTEIARTCARESSENSKCETNDQQPEYR